MTEQEVRDIIQSLGWSFLRRERRGRSYVYAARKLQGRRHERYICSLAAIAHMTLDQLVLKLKIVIQGTVGVDVVMPARMLVTPGQASPQSPI